MGSHGIVIDEADIAWFNADGGSSERSIRRREARMFEPPRSMSRVGGRDVERWMGMVWMTTNDGALRFDPKSQMFQEFQVAHAGFECRTYGIATDADMPTAGGRKK